MAKVSQIPFSVIGDLFAGVREASARRRSCVRVVVEVDATAPRELVGAIKRALMPETPLGLVHVAAVGEGRVRINPDADLALVVVGERAAGCEGVARAFAAQGVPCALVVESALEVDAPEALPQGVALVAAADEGALLEKLAEWMCGSCAHDVALAENFPFVRRATTRRLVRTKGAQNAALGLLPFGSGADLPLMTVNQALMALDIAGAYGEGADPARLAELGLVGVAAVASRGVARKLSPKVPGLGWLVKGAVAYAGTVLVGSALAARHELAQRTTTSMENTSIRPPFPVDEHDTLA